MPDTRLILAYACGGRGDFSYAAGSYAEGPTGVLCQTYTHGMTFSAAEFYEAGMSLPPDVRKDVALRLLESVETNDAFDEAAESWLQTEAAAAYDAMKADPSRAIPAEDVRAEFEAKWAARS